MERNEIAALAKGMVPFVRDVVNEAIMPLSGRIAELEARPIEKGATGEQGPQGERGPQGSQGEPGRSFDESIVSPELAAQVADGLRLLHESPPISIARQSPPSRTTSRISRIERDEAGNLVPVYEETRS